MNRNRHNLLWQVTRRSGASRDEACWPAPSSRLAPSLPRGSAQQRETIAARRQKGFSLIELVMVIVLLSLAAVALLQQFSLASSSLIRNEHLQTASQLAQVKAEELLAVRRTQGYSVAALDAGTSTENLIGNYAGYSRSVTIAIPPSSDCPSGAICKNVTVTVSRAADTLAEIALMLVSY
jgi:prepilin-type N-terminal cleavage/methylation domain-containing protein